MFGSLGGIGENTRVKMPVERSYDYREMFRVWHKLWRLLIVNEQINERLSGVHSSLFF